MVEGKTKHSNLGWQPVQEKKDSEFHTVEKATGNHSIIFIKKIKKYLWRVMINYILKEHGIKI